MPAESNDYIPPFEITPELQAQLAELTRQAMAQLEALVAAMKAAEAALPPPPPPETIIPIIEEPPPEIYTGGLEPSVLWLDAPAVMPTPIEKGEGAIWSGPMPLAVELSRVMPIELSVLAVEPAEAPLPAGFAPAEVVDLSGFWSPVNQYTGGEGGMF